MEKSGCKMSSTDGLYGQGIYECKKTYKKYNAEYCFGKLYRKYEVKKNGNRNMLENGFPQIWTLDFLKIHNCMICSSVIIEKDVIDKTGRFSIKNYADDYEYWLRILKHTDSVYVSNVCIYYDIGHAGGRKY